MPWGPIVFAAVALGFVLLVAIAVVRMRRKRIDAEEAGPDEAMAPSELEGADSAEEESWEEESAEDLEQPAGATPAPPEPGGGERPSGETAEAAKARARAPSATRPDIPHAIREQAKREQQSQAEQERLALGLAKTRGGFIARLGELFKGKSQLDQTLVEQIEEVLFTADIGVSTSQTLIDGIRRDLSKKELARPEAVWQHIKLRSAEILQEAVAPPLDLAGRQPFVILVVGVNGTGKTTTIGKLAARITEQGLKVVLAAGDTFRAAAAQQLEVWGQRSSAPVVKGKEGADPSSVIIDALKKAQELGAQVVIADTAGRLHTKTDLMEEIQKVRRSISKRVEGAPHETFLVLDATTGQNAIAQAKMFKDAVNITGIVLTKLDGTAKGGVVLGICNELKIPVRYIGIGEQTEDLREFDPQAFVEALYQESGA